MVLTFQKYNFSESIDDHLLGTFSCEQFHHVKSNHTHLDASCSLYISSHYVYCSSQHIVLFAHLVRSCSSRHIMLISSHHAHLVTSCPSYLIMLISSNHAHCTSHHIMLIVHLITFLKYNLCESIYDHIVGTFSCHQSHRSAMGIEEVTKFGWGIDI